MLLVGYEYGTNYLGAPVLGLVVWCVVCFALNTLLDLLYEENRLYLGACHCAWCFQCHCGAAAGTDHPGRCIL